MDQTNSAMAEAYNLASKLTAAIRMSSMNYKSSDQRTWTLRYASHSVSAWDFFVQRDTLRPFCSPALASPNCEAGQRDKILAMALPTFNWDARVEQRDSDPEGSDLIGHQVSFGSSQGRNGRNFFHQPPMGASRRSATVSIRNNSTCFLFWVYFCKNRFKCNMKGLVFVTNVIVYQKMTRTKSAMHNAKQTPISQRPLGNHNTYLNFQCRLLPLCYFPHRR
jgi:hypothetical protein